MGSDILIPPSRTGIAKIFLLIDDILLCTRDGIKHSRIFSSRGLNRKEILGIVLILKRFNSQPSLVVVSLDKTLHDDYLCLVESGRQRNQKKM